MNPFVTASTPLCGWKFVNTTDIIKETLLQDFQVILKHLLEEY